MWLLSRLARAAIDVVLPPVCLRCADVVAEAGTLCPRCWGEMTFLAAPWCARCGLPFEVQGEGGTVCAGCLASPPPWRSARAVLSYDDASRPLLLRFKHGDRLDGAPSFARWMARAGADLVERCDRVVPVPLHRFRLAMRRYNQAAVLASALGRRCGLAVDPDLLVRIRMTPGQGHLGPEARRRNVAGAFRVRRGADLRGASVLLIDDVLTTGATVAECVRVLTAAGAAGVDVLTLARVVASRA